MGDEGGEGRAGGPVPRLQRPARYVLHGRFQHVEIIVHYGQGHEVVLLLHAGRVGKASVPVAGI